MRTLAILFVLPAAVLAEDLLVDPMASTTNWTLTGQRVCYVLGKSKLEEVKDPVRPGSPSSLRLTYDLDRRHWIGIQWRGPAIPGRAESVGVWVFGDESKHHLVAHLADADGRTYDVLLGRIDWAGWREVSVPMEESRWRVNRRYGDVPKGAEAPPVRWPITVREFRVVKTSPEMLLSSIAFSEMRAVSRVAPADRVEIVLAADAPANVFYAPEPVVLKAAFSNPTEAVLQGRVETLVNDWLGGERRFDGGDLTLKAGEKVERELRLPLSELGSFKVWVRFRVGDACREVSQRIAVSRKPADSPKLDTESPFGMGLYLARFRKEEELLLAIRLAREAGVKWTRDGFNMTHMAPEPGRWAWEGPRWGAGKVGGAVELVGGYGFTVQSSPSLNRPCATGELTMAFWMKFLKLDYSDRWRVLLSKGDGPQRQFYLYLTVPLRQIAISFGDGANSWSDLHCAKSEWTIGQWYHVVVAHRRADRSVRWWVDGVPAGTSEARFANTLFENDAPLEIGRTLSYGLDDLAIYDRALPPEALHGATPVARWTFDETQGRRAADASGNGNHGEMKPFRTDFNIEQAAAAGIGTYVILMGTPKWMASKPTEDLDRPWNVLPQLDKWGDAVCEIVARYKDRGIRVWEIWNEPNIEPFWSPAPDPAEYYQVLAAAYAAIKKADPDATVLGCSLAGPHGPRSRKPYDFVEEVLKLGGGKVMDAISIHPYRQPRSPEDSEYVEDIKAISDLTAKYGRRLPIWITEVGWPNDSAGSSEMWATKMLPRSYLLALASGVKNIAWYDYHDDGEDPSYLEHNCGLLLFNMTPKPLYFAFRTMATELAGMRFEREVSAGPGATALVFAAGERRTAVAWRHRDQAPMAFRVGDAGNVELLHLMGNPSQVRVRDGALLMNVGEDAVFLRNVPSTLEVVQPLACEPVVLKVPNGETGELSIAIHNPFSKPLELRSAAGVVTISPNVRETVRLQIAHDQARDWRPPVWRSPDGAVELATPARVVALTGQRAPLCEWKEESSKPVEVENSSGLNATDEVTIACWLRSDGPSDSWQAPVTKWDSDQVRNFGLYLGREKGELCFSASFEKGAYRHTDLNSDMCLFDAKWHFIVVTYSKHDAEVRFHVDGALVKRVPFDGGDLKSTGAAVRVGLGFARTEGNETSWRGAVRDVRIWNRALSADEIAQLKR